MKDIDIDRMQNLLEKINRYDAVFILEATDLIQKYKLLGDTFLIPFSIIRTCSIVEKEYVGFSTIEIRDSSGKVIGIKVQSRNGETCQITLLTEAEKVTTEYRVSCSDFDSIMVIEKEEQYSTFEFTKDRYFDHRCTEEGMILKRIDQMIDNIGEESNKIYHIKRKRQGQ